VVIPEVLVVLVAVPAAVKILTQLETKRNLTKEQNHLIESQNRIGKSQPKAESIFLFFPFSYTQLGWG
jgi:hypothetical protein